MYPIIGITCSTSVSTRKWSELESCLTQDMVSRNYTHAVVAVGGAPVLIPLFQEVGIIETLAVKLDGLILTGGVDLDPAYFNEEPETKLGAIDPDKDQLEFQLTRLALKMNIPILGVCRGIQILNVVAGGSLYQDIFSQISTPLLKHFQQAPIDTPTHSVRIEKGTLLHKILKEDHIKVNSHHHQAVKDLAPEFRVTAVSPDGVVEGIEHTTKAFVVGVQWHPEGSFRRNLSSQQLFQAFVEAAKDRITSLKKHATFME